jgi:hypothetical protein
VDVGLASRVLLIAPGGGDASSTDSGKKAAGSARSVVQGKTASVTHEEL